MWQAPHSRDRAHATRRIGQNCNRSASKAHHHQILSSSMSASRLSVTRVVVGLRVRRSTFPLLETACRVDFVAPAAQRKSGLVLLVARFSQIEG